jgi:hypothetical protein
MPQRLVASSTPRNEADIDLVAQMGIKTVLTLKRDKPLDVQWFAFRAAVCTTCWLPVAKWKGADAGRVRFYL